MSASVPAEHRIVVLDTSCLVGDPKAYLAYRDDVVVPLTVISELDGLKRRQDEVGYAARTVLRDLEKLRASSGDATLQTPVPLPHGGSLRILINGLALERLREAHLDPTRNDNRIIAAALGQRDEHPGSSVVVVSADACLRLTAGIFGLQAIEHRARQAARPGDRGFVDVEDIDGLVTRLYHTDVVTTDALPDSLSGLRVNEFATVSAGSSSALVRRRVGGVERLGSAKPSAWGLRPRSAEQRFALELLLDPDVPLVALDGRSGTGKTILALAAGLEQVVERDLYDRVSVFRPIVAVGKADLGYLPGDEKEKLAPWMSAVADTLLALTLADDAKAKRAERERTMRATLEQLTKSGQLTMESVTFLRGRSLARTFVVIDEAQNLSRGVVKTVLTRLAEGSKVVLIGDTGQIDDPYLSADDNGLAALIAAFAGQELFGHVRLSRCERSKVADLADELL